MIKQEVPYEELIERIQSNIDEIAILCKMEEYDVDFMVDFKNKKDIYINFICKKIDKMMCFSLSDMLFLDNKLNKINVCFEYSFHFNFLNEFKEKYKENAWGGRSFKNKTTNSGFICNNIEDISEILIKIKNNI